MSSGFAAQLGSATVTFIGTYFGLPLCTTNLIVMSIIGIGVIDSAYADVVTSYNNSPNLYIDQIKSPIIEEEEE